MDEDDRPHAREPPRWIGQVKRPLDGPRHDAALAVQEEKGNDADERRQRRRKRRDRLQEAASAKLHAAENERQRQSHRGRANHRANRDHHCRPERLAIAWTVRELAPVAESVRERAGDNGDVRVDDAPEQEREHGRGERPRRALAGLHGATTGTGSRTTRTDTLSPSRTWRSVLCSSTSVRSSTRTR